MQTIFPKSCIVIASAIVLSALISSCGGSKSNSQTVTDSVSKSVTTVNAPKNATDSLVGITDPTAKKIMQGLYRDYNVKDKTAAWLCNNPDKLAKFKVSGDTKFSSKLLFLDSITVKGVKQLYVITSSRPDGDEFVCHSCAPLEEVFIFEKDAPAWRLIYRKIFDQVGSFGESPEFTLKKLGTDSYGFLINPGFTGQGIEEQSIGMYSYYQAEFKSILTIPEVAMDNKGACDDKVPGSCWGYDYTLIFATTPANYNDIILTKKGTESKDGKVMPVDTTIKYQFAGNAYMAK